MDFYEVARRIFASVPAGKDYDDRLVRAVAAELAKHDLLVFYATKVLETFEKDEAQGYRSRDRQFAIELLGKALRG